MSRRHRTVVVGASLAGSTAAIALRALGDAGEITLIGDEAHAPYNRPPLSKDVLRGRLGAEALALPALPADIVQRRETRAVGLDRAAREVIVSGGERIGYDRLVIATGARARRFVAPPQQGSTPVHEWQLRTLDNALDLGTRLAARPRVLVIGAGFIGMEAASVCRDLGCEVAMLSRREPLTEQLGGFFARRFAQAARDAGVVLYRIAAPGQALVSQGRLMGVTWDDGRRIEADVVITAIGCQPNIEWLAGSGLAQADGVPVDARCRAAPDIVAAGDVALLSPSPGAALRRVPLWTHAGEQARAAAASLVLGDAAEPYRWSPYGWTEAFGLAVKIAGPVPVHGEPEVIDGDLGSSRALLRWHGPAGTTVAALNLKLPVARLRRLAA